LAGQWGQERDSVSRKSKPSAGTASRDSFRIALSLGLNCDIKAADAWRVQEALGAGILRASWRRWGSRQGGMKTLRGTGTSEDITGVF
jgi:hypothetical protein